MPAKKSPKCKQYGKLKSPTKTGRVCKKRPGARKSPLSQPKRTPGGKKTLYCVKCRKKVPFNRKDLCVKKTKNNRYLLQGKHDKCGVVCSQFIAKDKAHSYKNC